MDAPLIYHEALVIIMSNCPRLSHEVSHCADPLIYQMIYTSLDLACEVQRVTVDTSANVSEVSTHMTNPFRSNAITTPYFVHDQS